MSQVERGWLTGKTLDELWQEQRTELFGERFGELDHFPLLFKVLDAQDKLSIQVHPPAKVAAELGGEPKNEMWYVADAQPGAKLYIGLKAGVTEEAFAAAIENGGVEELVHSIEPKAGEFIYIPSGRLHAIGAGLLIYEIQQSSDTTYRVFDWNRLGLDGKPRDLHVAPSMKCIDFEDIEPTMDQPHGNIITQCDDFVVRWLETTPGNKVFASNPDECVIITVLDGELHSDYDTFQVGDFFLLPRNSKAMTAGKNGANYLETSLG